MVEVEEQAPEWPFRYSEKFVREYCDLHGDADILEGFERVAEFYVRMDKIVDLVKEEVL